MGTLCICKVIVLYNINEKRCKIMKKYCGRLCAVLIFAMIIFSFNAMTCLAIDNGLTDEENNSFITRDEFTVWRKGFIASLSELDLNATQRILKDMNFYDMQYKVTDTYKWKDGNNTSVQWYQDYVARTGKRATTEEEWNAIVEDMVIEEKISRGLL